MSLMDIVDEALGAVEEALDDLPQVNASKIGLDSRAGEVWVNVDDRTIIVCRPRTLDYYGGFEYVDEEATIAVGDYKIYTDECSRVAKAVDFYINNHAEASDE